MPRFLAIDADAHGLFVAAATLRGKGAVALERTAALADDTPPLSPVNAAALGAKLKQLLKDAGIKPAPVLLCVGRDRVIPKEVLHPPTPPAEEPAVVRFQAVRDLSEGPDDVVMDYIPLAGSGPDGEKRAMAVFLRKPTYTAAKQLCEAAGLKLAAVTPRPFATAAALRHAFATGAAPAPEDPNAAVAAVTLWDRGGEFTVFRGQTLLFTRTVPAHALSGEASLTAELKRNLAVYAGQNPAAPVEAVYVAEADDPGIGWAGRVAAALPVTVHTFDPLAGDPGAELIPPPLRGRFAGPVGLLAGRAAGPLPINFVTPRQPKAEAGPARTRVLLGALAGVLLFAMIGGYVFLQLDAADRRVRELTAERNLLDDQLKLVEVDAKRLAAADEFAAREVNPLDELYDLTDRVPDVKAVTVTDVDISALPPTAKKPTGPAGSSSAAAPRNTPPPPVAQMRLTLRTSDANLAQRVADGFGRDKYYIGVAHTIGGQGGGDVAAKGQPHTIVAQVVHRKPGDYARALHVSPPPKPAAKDDEEFGGFGGGFGP